MAVFCIFYAVFSYSSSPSTSSRTDVIERKTYTFDEPSNILVFLEIMQLPDPGRHMLPASLAAWSLSQPTAVPRTKYLGLLFGVVYNNRVSFVCFTRCGAALAHSCCGMGHRQGCTPTTKATTERFSNFWRAVFKQLGCHLFLR